MSVSNRRTVIFVINRTIYGNFLYVAVVVAQRRANSHQRPVVIALAVPVDTGSRRGVGGYETSGSGPSGASSGRTLQGLALLPNAAVLDTSDSKGDEQRSDEGKLDGDSSPLVCRSPLLTLSLLSLCTWGPQTPCQLWPRVQRWFHGVDIGTI